MNLAGRDEHVYPMPLGAFDRRVHLFYVARVASGKATDHGAQVLVRYSFDGLEVARRRCRETGFDNVDTQFGKRSGDTQFLPQRHAAARRLLAIAQRRVENSNATVRARV